CNCCSSAKTYIRQTCFFQGFSDIIQNCFISGTFLYSEKKARCLRYEKKSLTSSEKFYICI
ncbi:MAG: hypothetical protein BWK80_25310, partial [Desulfobacteraceae bacterium IS3]